MSGPIHDRYATRAKAGELQHDEGQLAVLDALERIRAALTKAPRRGLWFARRPQAVRGL